MTQSLPIPATPMLAKATATIPTGEFMYEPKWDGFRILIVKDGSNIELRSRGAKPLTRYFPEVIEGLAPLLPERVVLDGEIVVRQGSAGSERLDWEALSARIHPAASRIERLSVESPASIVAFDLVAIGDQDLTQTPFIERRKALEGLFEALPGSDVLHLTRTTRDPQEASRWFEQFEGAGLDGVMAKPLEGTYEAGKRTMLKIKHKRTAEAVLVGYRIHKSGNGIGSLLLGLYDEAGNLFNVGGISAFTAKRRLELVEELDDLVLREDDGTVNVGETERSRFSSSKDVSFVRLKPERVIEVSFDQLEGRRFRHSVGFLRWRPDRDPRSCTIEQVDRAPAYDLGRVLAQD